MFKKFFKTIILTFIILVNANVLLAQVYEFPQHGWKTPSLSYAEKVAILQVPQDKLLNMPTTHLVETCLNYPLFSNIWLYNSTQEGLEWIIKDFNGLQELIKRKDADIELLKKYGTMSPQVLNKNWSDIEKGEFCAKFVFIEMLLAQNVILDKLNDDARTELVRESISKHDLMVQHGEYDKINYESNSFLIGKIMQKVNYSKFNSLFESEINLREFIKNGSHGLGNIVLEIVNIAKQYLNENNN